MPFSTADHSNYRLLHPSFVSDREGMNASFLGFVLITMARLKIDNVIFYLQRAPSLFRLGVLSLLVARRRDHSMARSASLPFSEHGTAQTSSASCKLRRDRKTSALCKRFEFLATRQRWQDLADPRDDPRRAEADFAACGHGLDLHALLGS